MADTCIQPPTVIGAHSEVPAPSVLLVP